MAVTFNAYNDFIVLYGNNTINLGSDTFRITLHNGYTFNADHTQYSEVSATELPTGDGYTQQNKDLTSVTWDRTNGTAKFDAANVSWTSTNPGTIGPATGAIVYSATSINLRLCFYIDFGGTETATNGQEFQINWNTNGIWTSAFQ